MTTMILQVLGLDRETVNARIDEYKRTQTAERRRVTRAERRAIRARLGRI